MILTVVKISLLRLWNSKGELALVFLVPVIFFSIFALIFSQGVGRTPGKVRISVICDAPSPKTQRVIEALVARDELQSVTGIGRTAEQWPIERLSKRIISHHDAEVVIYIPPNYGALHLQDGSQIRILHEGTNPISSQVVEAALTQALVAEQIPAASQSLSPFRLASTTLPTSQLATTAANLDFIRENVFASNKHQPKIAMYAAGIAVMFLLFSASGAGAGLLEEKEAGTLERLLASRMSLHQLLLGKWIYITGLGMLQISVMFAWGQLVFQVDLVGHLSGFVAMALATSAASASFALLLATTCRSRNQLNGVSLVLVLVMSALGGSMIPRYIMSESMQQLGRYTFNGWALDGFKKIFWYDLPLSAIRTEVLVLLTITVLFAATASLLIRRWSSAT